MSPLDSETIKSGWAKDGYVIIRGLLDPARIEELRRICDRILEQWVRESSRPEEAANSTNMAFLTEPRYFRQHPQELKALLNFVADENIFGVLEQLHDGEPLFHNTQYFFEPKNHTRGGDWHRDQQFGAPDVETEKARMRDTVGIHAHIAFLPDSNLEFVPGSHARWDTQDELRVRKGLYGAKKSGDAMPGAQRINLDRGDAVFFSAWALHRGNYVAGVPRRTFDAIYGSEPGWYTPPPTCFLQPYVLDGLTDRAQNFFRRFIDTYKDRWLKGSYEA
jgi:ectoine hydroxylase-related dioxygenase (phytanoyl-CoA dioxygenase family)